jgi:hypothetical protein
MKYDDICECGGCHQWSVEDSSIDHELGTEVMVAWICEKCGEVTTKEPEVFL